MPSDCRTMPLAAHQPSWTRRSTWRCGPFKPGMLLKPNRGTARPAARHRRRVTAVGKSPSRATTCSSSNDGNWPCSRARPLRGAPVMGMTRRDYVWLVAACCVGLACAAGAYRHGHQRGWLDAEAAGFQAGLNAARENSRQRAAEAFEAGYALGKVQQVLTQRQQKMQSSGVETSCVACHAERPSNPPEVIK